MPDNAAGESVTVAVQGELGSNSELAGREYFEGLQVSIVPCRTFAAMFAAVDDGDAAFGMAPVDNALGGSIHDVWRLFVEHPVPVDGEIYLRINHCLIGRPGSDIADITRIYSHPQALAQCRDFLASLDGVRVEEVYDTAGAVKMIRDGQEEGAAAIASAQAAAYYGMEVLAEDLQPRRDNYTRFLVLARQEGTHIGDLKTTVVVAVDGQGDLAAIAGPFESRGIEVLKVEIGDSTGADSPTLIYLEFDATPADSAVAAALEELKAATRAVHIVGSYTPGRRVEPRMHHR